jgi:hypothetical protein
MMAWYRALGLGMMVFVQRDRWCLLLVLPCWVEGQWEIPLVGLKIGGALGGPGGLGEIDRALQLWGCRGLWSPLLARRHCRMGPLEVGLPVGGRRLLVVVGLLGVAEPLFRPA